MQCTRFLTLGLVFTLTSALGAVAIAQEAQTNSQKVNTPSLEKNTQKIQQKVTPQQTCPRYPYC